MSAVGTAGREPARVAPRDTLRNAPRDAVRDVPREPVRRTHVRTERAPRGPMAWPVDDRTIPLHDVRLESGEVIPLLQVHYRLEGEISTAFDNVVLVVHALTGTSHASAWWEGVIESGGALDPARHAILCASLLGGCGDTRAPELPPFTTRDQAAVLARLLDALHVERPLLVCGGSLGGMVTLEFAASYPDRVRAAVALAAPAAQTAQGLAWNTIMRRAIEVGGTREGLALARMIAMLSYRTPAGLERRFGRARGTAGDFAVNDWLSGHGEKLVARFDAEAYLGLLDAMDTHDVGRGRGGITAALAPVADRLTGVGIVGDLLYPADAIREWTASSGAEHEDVSSVHGHDAFLLETARVSGILRAALSRAERE